MLCILYDLLKNKNQLTTKSFLLFQNFNLMFFSVIKNGMVML